MEIIARVETESLANRLCGIMSVWFGGLWHMEYDKPGEYYIVATVSKHSELTLAKARYFAIGFMHGLHPQA